MKATTRRRPQSKTAQEAFDRNRKDYALLMERLQAKMVEKAAWFAKNNTRWDAVGDERHAVELLAQVLGALGDREAAQLVDVEF